jgi:hypothetical protein
LIAGPLISDANGMVCPRLAPGTYWIDPTNGGGYPFPLNRYIWEAQNVTLQNNVVFLWLTPVNAQYGCCPAIPFPIQRTLYLTVCGQTYMLFATGPGLTITGWVLPNGTASINTPGVAVVDGCNLGEWDGVTTTVQTVPWAVRLFCPTSTTAMIGSASVCGIGHFKHGVIDAYAICPAQCIGVGNAWTCCSAFPSPEPTDIFNLSGNIDENIAMTGSMPATMPSSCVLSPAQPWPMPCAGDGIGISS